ncbi:hypothetical protein QQF64_034228 [Cirrhinus molitorella]|uniref:Uncharacterized protein n=1 Tax=Cirrhinus molitorella TaxID=172907 RepID=A0ABR3MW38_9TELE
MGRNGGGNPEPEVSPDGTGRAAPGGTIDITVHEVLGDGRLKELHAASGNDMGGQSVDRNVISFLKDIFSEDIFEKFEKEHPGEALKLKNDIAFMKSCDDVVRLSCPVSLQALAKDEQSIESYFEDVQGAEWDEGAIFIEEAKLRSFFDTSFNAIESKIRQILKAELSIECMLLVGGYAESPFLRNFMQKQFGSECKILCPVEPQAVILKGAIRSERQKVRFVDEPGVEEVGSFSVDMPNTDRGLDRVVKLEIKFGSTEMQATATDLESEENEGLHGQEKKEKSLTDAGFCILYKLRNALRIKRKYKPYTRSRQDAPNSDVTNQPVSDSLFQARGSPHIHLLAWIKGAPEFENDSDKEVCDFIDRYIICQLPDPTTNPELHKIVTEVQLHSRKHSKSCKKGNVLCRYGFPKLPTSETTITHPRHSIMRKMKMKTQDTQTERRRDRMLLEKG